MSTIFKILRRDEWQAAQGVGTFTGSAVDLRDGYIHFSTAKQLGDTALLHFRGQRDLVVLEVSTADLHHGLKWEASRGGSLFPHLYGVLPVSHVLHVYEAPLDAEGVPNVAFLKA